MPVAGRHWRVVPAVAARPAGYLNRWFLCFSGLKGLYSPGGGAWHSASMVQALFGVGGIRNGRRESWVSDFGGRQIADEKSGLVAEERARLYVKHGVSTLSSGP